MKTALIPFLLLAIAPAVPAAGTTPLRNDLVAVADETIRPGETVTWPLLGQPFAGILHPCVQRRKCLLTNLFHHTDNNDTGSLRRDGGARSYAPPLTVCRTRPVPPGL